MTYWRLHYHLVWGTQDREPSMETVMAYAAKQKEHHREKKLITVYERMDE